MVSEKLLHLKTRLKRWEATKLDQMTPKQIMAEIRRLRSLSYACISQDQGRPIDLAIESLERGFEEMGWQWKERGDA